MRFSLIVGTLGRVDELKDLCRSLNAQTFRDFEVIIVDQNPDDRLGWIDEPGQFSFSIVRKASSVQQLSHARNIGLQFASGEIVAFPDDDCIYPPDLLAMVDRAFAAQPTLGVRTGPVLTPSGRFGSGRWRKNSGKISIYNVWRCSASINIFLRRNVITAIGGFDEALGVGGAYGSGEDTDIVVRALEAGWQGWYEVAQVAIHPDKALTPTAVNRAFAYGAGFGYILRKHHAPIPVSLTFMLRPLGGFLFNILRGRRMNADYYWGTLCGRMYGFGSYKAFKSQ